MLRRALLSALCAAASLSGCKADSEAGRTTSRPGMGDATAAVAPAAGGGCAAGRYCQGALEITRACDGSTARDSQRDCAAQGLSCQPSIGCAACQPNLGVCEGNNAMVCRADGSGYDPAQVCDLAQGQLCLAGTCTNPCAQAEVNRSYIGCEYWPTPVLNSQLDREFEFAVIVANPQLAPATVTISLGARELTSVQVPVSGVRAIELPWIAELKGEPQEERSALVSPGAYRLKSNVPVTVYQFNPLEFRIPQDCASESRPDLADSENPAIDGECFSYSNDASLLLPTHVLANDYIIVSRAAMVNRVQNAEIDIMTASPGFFTVIGADPNGADVTLDLTAHVVASLDGTISALAPGDTATFRLDQGDVLQVVTQSPTDSCQEGIIPPDALGLVGSNMVSEVRSYCAVSSDYDLTGSEVHATGKVAVTAGHNCRWDPLESTCRHASLSIL